jgi:hypothetical protein
VITDLMNQPCVITHRSEGTTQDELGNAVPDESRTSTTCNLQQRQNSVLGEQPLEGELADSRWLMFLPAATEIDVSDTVEVDGAVYEVVGEPNRQRNPWAKAEHHVEVSLRRTATAGQGS